MLGVLLESRARRQRRGGGAALSVAVHLALIAAITMTTVRVAPARARPEPAPIVHFTPPKTVSPPVARVVRAAGANAPIFRLPDVVHIPVPRMIPTSLPPVDFTAAGVSDNDKIEIGGGSGPVAPRGILDGDGQSNTEWRGTELLMRIVTTAKPRYPESLRTLGIEGQVVVRFTVDTTGRVDSKTAQIVSSTNVLFSRAVLDALNGFRFKPAEVGNRRVAALAEMPFEFRISR